jgi:CRP-like cAMP-binding protein
MPNTAESMRHDGPITGNQLLAALPPELLNRLRPHSVAVSLTKGQTLYEAGERVPYVFFPTAGLISLLGTTADGGSVEIAGVTNDGMIGFPTHLQPEVLPYAARVLVAGQAVRVHAHLLDAEIRHSAALQLALLQWSHRLLDEASQAVVCHRFHTLLERLCRWLLTATDRLQTERLSLTHEMLACALGAPRTGVTTAAVALQDAGAINYRHGHITVLNRRRLELSACECYGMTRSLAPHGTNRMK